MSLSRSENRRRRRAVLSPDALEGRSLLSGGVGSTFAVIPGTIAGPGQSATVPFTINSANFTRPAGRVVLGVDVVADTSTPLKPQISAVNVTNAPSTDPSAAHPRSTHALYAPGVARNNTSLGPQTSAVLVQFNAPRQNPPANKKGPAPLPLDTTNPAINGEVIVKGMKDTTGKFLVGFYLPGDSNGDGVVNATDVQAVRTALGSKAGDARYQFDADANRDGRITSADLRTATQNEGVSTNILPTISSNLDPATADSNRATNLAQVHFTGVTSPFTTVTYGAFNSQAPPVTTTTDASGNYSVIVPVAAGSNTFQVTTQDTFGQSIQGTIGAVTRRA